MGVLSERLSRLGDYVRFHGRVIWALLIRELATRYGRDNIGFLWIVAEPLMFVSGVMVMYSIIRSKYDHGLLVIPFLVTGYLPLTLLRHMIGQGINCVRANANLLYHRKITLLHLFMARTLLEFVSVSLAFVIVVSGMLFFNVIIFPASIATAFTGWVILAWMTFGMVLIFGSINELFPDFEKVINLITYIMIPATGTFFMIGWLPAKYRPAVEKIPLINCVEMIRAGFFGEFVRTYYNVTYMLYWAAGLTLVGLFMLMFVRSRIDIE